MAELRLRAGYMLFANRCEQAELRDTPEHVRGNVGTPGVVTEIFLKLLFAAVWTRDPRLNGYPGHSDHPFGPLAP